MKRLLFTFFVLANLSILSTTSLFANSQVVDANGNPSKRWFGLGTLPQPSWVGKTTRVEESYETIRNYSLGSWSGSGDFVAAFAGGGFEPHSTCELPPPKAISLNDKNWSIDSSASTTITLKGFQRAYSANDDNEVTKSHGDSFDRKNSRYAEVVSSDGVVLSRTESHGHIDSSIDDESFSIYGELFTSEMVHSIVQGSRSDGSVAASFEADYLVTRPVEITIDGTLASLGLSHAAFELISLETDETLFSLGATRGVENSISVSTTLEPGEYRFSIDATGESGRFVGRSDAQFDFEFSAFELDPPTSTCSTWADDEWNDNRDFDHSDFLSAFTTAESNLATQNDATQTVPEPSSVALSVFGGLGILAIRRRVELMA